MGHTFRLRKENLKSKDKSQTDTFLYDLENTFIINLELLKSMLENTKLNNKQISELSKKLDALRESYDRKKQLREEKMVSRRKILMDQQIMEEARRRNEENIAYYQEQIEEHRENMEKKESFIKQYEKKFNEVEIFIQREAKNSQIYEYSKFSTFEILEFINQNEILYKKRNTLLDERRSTKTHINTILKENVELKKREEFIEESLEFDTKQSKYEALIKSYKDKIGFLNRNKEQLHEILRNLSERLDYLKESNSDLHNKILEEGEIKEIIAKTHKKVNSMNPQKFNKLGMNVLNTYRGGKPNINNLLENNNINSKYLEEGTEEKDESVYIKEEEEEEIEENDNDEVTSVNKSALLEFNDESPDIMGIRKGIYSSKLNTEELNNDGWDISCIINNNE